MANSQKVSRRAAIKAAVAAALVYGASKTSATTSYKGKKAKKVTGLTDTKSSLPVLAVWLALTARDHFEDFDPSTTKSADLAHKLATDMGLPTGGIEESTIKSFIDSLRDPNTPQKFASNAAMYSQVHSDLSTLSAVLYPPGQCPKQYATLMAMAAGNGQ